MNLLILVLLLIIVVTVCDRIWWWTTQNWPPSPFRYPIVGNPFSFFSAGYKSFTDMGRKYGGIYSLHAFHKHFVFLNDWKIMKEALVGQSDVFSSRPEMLLTKAMVSVEDILFIDGPVWKEKRRFTIHHLRNFGVGKTVMESVITDEASKISDVLGGHTGRPLEMTDIFFMPVLNVLWQIIGGRTYDYDDNEIKEFANVIKEVFALGWESIKVNFFPSVRMLPFNLFHIDELQASARKVLELVAKEVEEHERTLQSDAPRDYIDAYLTEIDRRKNEAKDDGQSCYSKSHLIGAIFDMFHAGIETTATTMEWALLYMAIWPEIQRNVQRELDMVVGRGRLPIYSDHLGLPYTRATLMEIQRYSTVIPLCSPRVAAVTTQLAGYTIAKDAVVIQNLWAVHHDKAYWGDPEVFRPSRFLNDLGQVEKFENLIPFSTGPRICLGESLARVELFLFFTSLLHKYTFHCPAGRELPSLEPVQSLTLHPRQFKLVIRARTL